MELELLSPLYTFENSTNVMKYISFDPNSFLEKLKGLALKHEI